jgi:hypothetical protein
VSLGAKAGLFRASRWLSRALVEPPLPLVAVEVRPDAVGAVRLARDGRRLSLASAATAELPEGTLEVSLTRPNVRNAASFESALGTVLERTGALSAGAVSLVLPDPAVRLTLLPASEARGSRKELAEVIRFRLHKALPPGFDVRGARLAFRARGAQLLVALASDEVVRGYEEAVVGLGLRVGLVEPAGLALASLGLDAARDGGDRLLVNWDRGYVSFFLWRGLEPLLLRTLPREDGREAVARQLAQTLRFHRDQLGERPLEEVALRVAAVSPEEGKDAIASVVGIEPRLVRPWEGLGIDEDGPAAQAVAAAAACVMRRAA